MSSDSAGALGADVPSPEGLQELIDALKTACSEVAAARHQVEADCKGQVEQVRAEAGRSIASAQAAADRHQRELRGVLDEAMGKLAELERRAAELVGRMSGELDKSKKSRGLVDAGVDELASAVHQVRVDREAWEARGRASSARNEAVVQELRRELAGEKARVSALVEANKRLKEDLLTLGERLDALENRKRFGLF